MRCDDLHSPMKPGVINCASTRPASAGGDGAKSGGELPAHAVHHFAQSTQQTPCEQAPPSLEEPPSLEAPPSRECITGSFSHGGNNGGESVLLVSAHSSRRTSCA